MKRRHSRKPAAAVAADDACPSVGPMQKTREEMRYRT
jgi:hypothetical protein